VVVVGSQFDVDLGPYRLHAQRWGSPSGALVIGVPGLAGNVENFAFLGERLGTDARQLVALDLRGRGRSDTTPAGTYGWENHALDVLRVADVLGFDRFAVIGQSMGASVAMKVAESDGSRLDAVVLVDVAGRVDPGVGAAIAGSIARLGKVYASASDYLDEVRGQGLVSPWSEYWDRAYRYDLRAVDGGVAPATSLDAVREDRAYTATQDPYDRWASLTMPTLLLRARRELRPGSGHTVPAADRDRFIAALPHATVAEIDANHLTINTHPATPTAIHTFLP
jgi:pimeloyl-ACP methyl ester carboxylesterase